MADLRILMCIVSITYINYKFFCYKTIRIVIFYYNSSISDKKKHHKFGQKPVQANLEPPDNLAVPLGNL